MTFSLGFWPLHGWVHIHVNTVRWDGKRKKREDEDEWGRNRISRGPSHHAGARSRVLALQRDRREWPARPTVSAVTPPGTKVKETFKQTNINQSLTDFRAKQARFRLQNQRLSASAL